MRGVMTSLHPQSWQRFWAAWLTFTHTLPLGCTQKWPHIEARDVILGAQSICSSSCRGCSGTLW